MIVGIGTDLCKAERLQKGLESPAFLRRVFSEAEQALLASRTGKARLETAAANFAAKEALLKAAGTGLGGFAMSELSVLRLPGGQPCFALAGRALAWQTENGLTLHVSLSHEAGLATAFVVAEKTEI